MAGTSEGWKKRREPSLEAYLLARIKKVKGPLRTFCWEWTLEREGENKSGWAKYDGKIIRAHRASFVCFKGPIPKGKLIRHKCDNPPCINPNHLEPGNDQDNRNDFMKRNPRAAEILKACAIHLKKDASKNGKKGGAARTRAMTKQELVAAAKKASIAAHEANRKRRISL